jgi:hypothetical protein
MGWIENLMRLPEQYLELFVKKNAETFHLFFSLKWQTKSLKTVCACKKSTDIILKAFKKIYHDPVSSIYWWINR